MWKTNNFKPTTTNAECEAVHGVLGFLVQLGIGHFTDSFMMNFFFSNFNVFKALVTTSFMWGKCFFFL